MLWLRLDYALLKIWGNPLKNSRSSTDVLLINPGNLKQVYQELGNHFTAIETPSLTALFATYLSNNGLSVDILDAPALNLDPTQAAERALKSEPKLVVLVVYGFQPSASTQNMPAASATASAIKALSPNTKVMMTGTHVAALPRRTLEEEEIDFVCDGEGPDTILRTAQMLVNKKTDYSSVPGLWFKDGDAIFSNPSAPLMDDLDAAMPGGSWHLLPMDKYRAHNWHCFDHINDRMPYASIHTTLGCPFKCSFCCINAPFGKPSYRMWSPSVVAKDIDLLHNEYGVKNIKFVDEMFVLNKAHVLGLCDELIARDYDLNIWAYARVDTVRDEFLVKLRQAGVRWLALGIESGSKHVRDGVEKGRFGTDDIIKVVRKIQDAGIYVIGNYIFGLPDDTHESMEETLQLAIDANCEFANFYSAMAYPGSQLYKMALEKEWELPSSWIGYSQHAFETHPLRTEVLTSGEVLKFRDEAFHRYFSNQKYLDLVNKKFGTGVLDNIKQMSTIRLKRSLYS